MNWEFSIDVGGTFTDCLARSPTGELESFKLLSDGSFRDTLSSTGGQLCITHLDAPDNFLKGWRLTLLNTERPQSFIITGNKGKVLELNQHWCVTTASPVVLSSTLEAPVVAIRYFMKLSSDKQVLPARLKLGTTRGTNALLERNGEPFVFVTTSGFGDCLKIGYQNRPDLFTLDIKKSVPLYSAVIEANERICADGKVIKTLDVNSLRQNLQKARHNGFESVAICFLHSYANPEHEEAAKALAFEVGMQHVTLSSEVSPLKRLVWRANTTNVSAYLGPIINSYKDKLHAQLPGCEVEFMTSYGGLVQAENFDGAASILSGPAGGAIGVETLAKSKGFAKAVGFDMGGTSSDVCLFDGEIPKRYEMEVTDPETNDQLLLHAPMLAIDTVAAGGGSICWYDGVRLRVGPNSAGANPGPACYGKEGPLTLTDCNLILGRIHPDQFPFQLNIAAANSAINSLSKELNQTPTQLADAFVTIAASTMAMPIKSQAIKQGLDTRQLPLIAFGGAGPQHACDVAESLGIEEIVIHPYSSLLSAFGISRAQRQLIFSTNASLIGKYFDEECQNLSRQLRARADSQESTKYEQHDHSDEFIYSCRYESQDHAIEIAAHKDWQKHFHTAHQDQFGYCFSEVPIEVTEVRLIRTYHQIDDTSPSAAQKNKDQAQQVAPSQKIFVDGQWLDGYLYSGKELTPHSKIESPCQIIHNSTTIMVKPGWQAHIDENNNFILKTKRRRTQVDINKHESTTQVSLFSNAMTAIARQMGERLNKAAMSVNIKERMDYSCAIFSSDGKLVVNAPHIPVHLGAMDLSIRAVCQSFPKMQSGDVYVLNNPYKGGSHLPDITVVTPLVKDNKVVSFLASRAHHAEIGGLTPGSMPAHAKFLYEEGVIIDPFALVSAGRDNFEQLRLLLSQCRYPSRNPQLNIADVKAQVSAGQLGLQLLNSYMDEIGILETQQKMSDLSMLTKEKIHQFIRALPEKPLQFEDRLHGQQKIHVHISKNQLEPPKLVFDFSNTSRWERNNFNANRAIVNAAVIYCLRCLVGEDIPLNSGILDAIEIHIPDETLLTPNPAAKVEELVATVGGNVETSQRIVDVVLGAFGVVAASQGTMNNFLFGREGTEPFGYYETIAGGSGAGKGFSGQDGVQTHMTNTRITDAEVIESRFPVRLLEFSIRHNSGGKGSYCGGNGLKRVFEFLAPLEVSTLMTRRDSQPYGLHGADAGAPGRNTIKRHGGQWEEFTGCSELQVNSGDLICIETPGGGGFGKIGSHAPKT